MAGNPLPIRSIGVNAYATDNPCTWQIIYEPCRRKSAWLLPLANLRLVAYSSIHHRRISINYPS
jgi:hypothetical protein